VTDFGIWAMAEGRGGLAFKMAAPMAMRSPTKSYREPPCKSWPAGNAFAHQDFMRLGVIAHRASWADSMRTPSRWRQRPRPFVETFRLRARLHRTMLGPTRQRFQVCRGGPCVARVTCGTQPAPAAPRAMGGSSLAESSFAWALCLGFLVGSVVTHPNRVCCCIVPGMGALYA
jgi:hypothetical protein